MGYNQALSAYRETRVRTASQGTLVIMLYDGAIRHLGEAISLFEGDPKKFSDRIEKISNHILKSQEIITELMASLDLAGGGDIAKNLLSLYAWFNEQLIKANMEKNPDMIIPVRAMMEDLRLAWVEVINSTAVPAEVQSAPVGINIAG